MTNLSDAIDDKDSVTKKYVDVCKNILIERINQIDPLIQKHSNALDTIFTDLNGFKVIGEVIPKLSIKTDELDILIKKNCDALDEIISDLNPLKQLNDVISVLSLRIDKLQESLNTTFNLVNSRLVTINDSINAINKRLDNNYVEADYEPINNVK